MTKLLQMTEKEFEEQKHKLRTLAASTTDLARLILVEGKTKSAAAKEAGVSRQNVKQAMDRALALLAGVPTSYVWFEGFMSPERAAKLKEDIQQDLEDQAATKSKNKS